MQKPSLLEVFRISESPSKKLRPELEKVVSDYARRFVSAATSKSGRPPEVTIADLLRDFAHEMEGAEGEDPAELDPGGPEPGTTGGVEEGSFAKLKNRLAHRKGVTDPAALAASIGRKKLGSKEMTRRSVAGRKK